MRELIQKRVLAIIDSKHYEFPCGFEIMMQEEGLELPERYIDKDWKEDPNWIIKVREHVPAMSDELLLEVFDQFLCLHYR